MLNALTFDLEDYYHAASFDRVVEMRNWDNMESRIERNCENILSILNDYKVTATFFVLGWIAERHPILIRTIFNEGHEISSHGFNHQMIYGLPKDSFKNDIIKTKIILEDITGKKVKGYRAPTFSINNTSLWALDIIQEQGHLYDSSIFPIKHDRYGIPDANRFPHNINLDGSRTIKEFPPSTLRILGLNIPIGGEDTSGYYQSSFLHGELKGLIPLKNNRPLFTFTPGNLIQSSLNYLRHCLPE